MKIYKTKEDAEQRVKEINEEYKQGDGKQGDYWEMFCPLSDSPCNWRCPVFRPASWAEYTQLNNFGGGYTVILPNCGAYTLTGVRRSNSEPEREL